MKKLLLIFCILGMGRMALAQWTTSGSDIYNSNAGNVGIGTTSPNLRGIPSSSFGQVLTVHTPISTARSALELSGGNGSATNNLLTGQISFLNGSNQIGYIYTANGSSSNATTGYMVFATSDAGTANEAMRITSTGNIGLGTATPNLRSISSSTFGKVLTLYTPVSTSRSVLELSGGNGTANNNLLTSQISFLNGSNQIGYIYTANGSSSDATTGYMVFGVSDGGTSNEAMKITSTGNVGIGTTSPASKLSVNGKIQAKEVKVETSWSDFVFEPQYKLRNLEETEELIKGTGHLPDIPSAAEVAKNGINVGEMNAKLLQKIEELTLYLIQSKKEVKDLQERMKIMEGKRRLDEEYNGKVLEKK